MKKKSDKNTNIRLEGMSCTYKHFYNQSGYNRIECINYIKSIPHVNFKLLFIIYNSIERHIRISCFIRGRCQFQFEHNH